MTAHIGIVACSTEGAALCYRTICAEGAALLGAHAHPEVSLHSPSLADYVARLDAGDMRGVADLMLSSANKLAAIDNVRVSYPIPNRTAAFDLTAGQDYTLADIGFKPTPGTSAIGDMVWVDANGDQVRNGGEPGLAATHGIPLS